MDCVVSAHGANAIGYGLTKREKVDLKNDPLAAMQQNENVIYLRADNLKVDSMLGTPDPGDVYRQMKLRHQAAGFKRKYGFWRIEICPSKEDWEKLLGFKPVPGHISEEQKTKIVEVANKLVDDSVQKLDVTDHWGYRHSGNGEKYTCVTGERSKIGRSQAVWAIHIDTDDIHIHGVANIVTENNETQDTNKCKDRGFQAGDKVAEKNGLKVLSQYDNQRKEKIHADAIVILKGMKEFDLQAYFTEMMTKGWIIEPNTPDKKGVIHGYSVGEKLYHNDGSPSSVIMFKSSELGHSKDLTPSHLYKTWLKLHQEAVQTTTDSTRRTEQPKQQTAPVAPISHIKQGRWSEEGRRQREEQRKHEEERKAAEARRTTEPKRSSRWSLEGRKIREEEQRLREKERKAAEARLASQTKSREQSSEEKEARSAVAKALSVIKAFVSGNFNVYERDERVDLLEGIVAKCLLGGRDATIINMNIAANELMSMVKGAAAQINKSLEAMTEISSEVQLPLPPITPTSGVGGGGPTGGWRDKDDDERWKWYKNLFGLMRPKGLRR